MNLKRAYQRLVSIPGSLVSRLIYYIFGRMLVVFPGFLANKRVILIGPARTVVEELEGINLSEFDVVVRMNRAVDVPIVPGGPVWRTDVLFHNFKESGDRGAGRVTAEKVDRAGIKFVIFPGGGARKALIVAKAIVKMSMRGVKSRVGMIPIELYEEIRRSVGGYSPTTGFVAMSYVLASGCREVSVVGFTFFQTKYVDGYNNDLNSDAAGMAWAEQRDIHNPRLEAACIKRMVDVHLASGRNVVLGKGVAQSLSNIGEVNVDHESCRV